MIMDGDVISFASPDKTDEGEDFRHFFHFRPQRVPETSFLEKYDVGMPLGKWEYERLVLVVEKATGKRVAAKKVRARRDIRARMSYWQFECEYEIIQKLRHPNICEWYETVNEEDVTLCTTSFFVLSQLRHILNHVARSCYRTR